MSIALLDGDVLCYECGFASDAGAKAQGLPNEPLAFCLNGVKEKIKTVVEVSGCEDYAIFLSNPKKGYRHEIFPDYKANRDPAHRPTWFKEIKEYLIEKHGAVFSEEGDEADDALGIAQTEMNAAGVHTVLCTKDKDLDMIPGWHYNWSKNRKDDGLYYVDELTADKIFYKQLLTGDSTDNIPGMYKILGKKATQKWLSPIDDMNNVKEMYEYVCEVYGGDVKQVDSIASLVWIKRTNEAWSPPC